MTVTARRPRRRTRLWELFAIVAAPWLLAAVVVWAGRSLEVDWTKAALWAVSIALAGGAVAVHGYVKAEAADEEWTEILLDVWADNQELAATLTEGFAVCPDCPFRGGVDV